MSDDEMMVRLVSAVSLWPDKVDYGMRFGCDDCGELDCGGECELNTVFPEREVDDTTEREDMDADDRYAWAVGK